MQIADTVIVIIIWLIEMPSKRCRQYAFFFTVRPELPHGHMVWFKPLATLVLPYGLVWVGLLFAPVWIGLGWRNILVG